MDSNGASRPPRSPVVRRHAGRRRVTRGRAGLYASAYPRMGSSIYLALGLVAIHGLGLTPVALLVAVGICILKAHNVKYYWWAPIANSYSLLVCTYVYIRVAMSMFYKEPADMGYTPTISLIVSAKKEEKHIGRSFVTAFSRLQT